MGSWRRSMSIPNLIYHHKIQSPTLNHSTDNNHTNKTPKTPYYDEDLHGNLEPRSDHSQLKIKLQEPPKKGASKEVYGFVCWITTFVAYVTYLLWAFLPEDALHSLGIYYYPSKWWAVAFPTFAIVSILYGLWVYICLNLISAEHLDSYYSFTDEYSKEIEIEEDLPENSIPPIADIPLTVVNQLLYNNPANLTPSFSNEYKEVISSNSNSSSSTKTKPPSPVFRRVQTQGQQLHQYG
eukprot:TRINITY_DN880_c0_g1_i3.p1 TRINITY_DN880_c0_g1~~TRINITY_DN880_c0_g1_i3.p1  ORF type:complete len:238 (-),score=48.64 TRINITY_DN880_c0_g1_i3:26-739(-)